MNYPKAGYEISNVIPNEREESGFLAATRNDRLKQAEGESNPMRLKNLVDVKR